MILKRRYGIRATCAVACIFASFCVQFAGAQVLQHPDPTLDSIFPAGGQQGQTVAVELRGLGGLTGAMALVIDGPPGVTAQEVKAVDGNTVMAKLLIAADAPPGRRLVRVLGGANGLTNFRYFFVSALPEPLETEPNDTPAAPQAVQLPVVVNARIQRTLDVDCFHFQAKAGQQITVAVVAHAMDGFVERCGSGFLDTSLELLDEKGTVVAAADDTLGLDPLIHAAISADGAYTVRVRSLEYKGSEKAVYRLFIGELPVATAAFPTAARTSGEDRQAVQVELSGPNVPPGTKCTIPADGGGLPVSFVAHPATAGVLEVPYLRSHLPTALESEPNNAREQSSALAASVSVYGRFLAAGDEDWFKVHLAKDEGLLAQTLAQRHLRSPADTVIEIYDAAGRKITENDDGRPFGAGVRWAHDFFSTDSWLSFVAPVEGDYFLRVRDQSGAEGPRAIYRLDLARWEADFELALWPDAVPIWGAGSSASFLVEALKWGGLEQEIAIAVEGLPPGWEGSVTNWPVGYLWNYNESYAVKFVLTITAPSDAKEGELAPFCVVGRTQHKGRTIEREAKCLTLYGNSHNDAMLLRRSPQARAVVARPLDTIVTAAVREVTVKQGETAKIPVLLSRPADQSGAIGLVVNGPTLAAGCGWGVPRSLKGDEREFTIELPTAEIVPGTHGITVARSWASDIRAGRPGPCTALIRLTVLPPK